MRIAKPAFTGLGLLLIACESAAPNPGADNNRAQSVQPRSIGLAERLVVKLVDEARVRVDAGGSLVSQHGSDLGELNARGLRFAPLVRVDEARLETLRGRARARSNRIQPDVMGFVVVDTDADLAEVAADLQQSPLVELAYIQTLGLPPPADIDPPTPDLVDLQGYLGPEPGINVVGAMGLTGAGVRISDCEYGWNTTHEELEDVDTHPEPGQTVAPEAIQMDFAPDHGTAVIGMLVGDVGGYGIDGMVPGAELHTYPEWTVEGGFRREAAIANAILDSDPGDIVVLEMQAADMMTGRLGPAELDPAVWMLVRMASDAGILVVAAAGNGTLDLDSPQLAYYRDRGDSGAIIVGAGGSADHSPTGFSSFGSRVDVQGWDDQIMTLGYGDHAEYGGDPNQAYTAIFGSTSGATPMVAAAAALVQESAQQVGVTLTPLQVRHVLVSTGTPQGPGGHIGPLVNAGAAAQAAQLTDDTAPTVTFTSPDDDVSVEESTYETQLEVSATDDSDNIVRVQLRIAGELQPVVLQQEPFVFDSVEFPTGIWEVEAEAEDVWGNVGISDVLTISVGVEPSPGTTTGEVDTGSDEVGTSGAETSGEETGASGDGGGCRVAGRPGDRRFALIWLLLVSAVPRLRNLTT